MLTPIFIFKKSEPFIFICGDARQLRLSVSQRLSWLPCVQTSSTVAEMAAQFVSRCRA